MRERSGEPRARRGEDSGLPGTDSWREISSLTGRRRGGILRRMEFLIGIFRCFLPARYWHEMRSGAIVSIFLTFAAGAYVGLRGLLDYAGRASEQAAKIMLQG